MSYVGISSKIIEKLREIVDDPKEFEIIIALLKLEKRYINNEDNQSRKREFQLLMDQYFPLGDKL